MNFQLLVYSVDFFRQQPGNTDTVMKVTKSVNVLTTLKWVALVWRSKEVKATAIQKCFGIRFDVHAIVSDPFNDIDDETSHAMGTLQHCPADEYLTGDRSFSVCVCVDCIDDND